MSQHLPYIAMESVVQDYLTESEQSNAKYFKVWNLAYRGLEDLGLDFFYKVQSVKLPINANLTVTLPADYMQWSKVGILNNQGEIIPLDYNDKLTTYADLLPDRIEKTQDNSVITTGLGNDTFYNYWNGYAYTNIYGVPSGAPRVGSFKVDTPNGVILLNERFQYEYLMLEYIASPVAGQEYYLPVQFREALVSWLRWMDNISTPTKTHAANANIQMRRKDYFNSRRLAIAKWKPIRPYDMYALSQQLTRLTIRS
tara:strand:- start:689 stop:1453 length:765 start_codon:yes stop_codon:yes gene_type:complete